MDSDAILLFNSIYYCIHLKNYRICFLENNSLILYTYKFQSSQQLYTIKPKSRLDLPSILQPAQIYPIKLYSCASLPSIMQLRRFKPRNNIKITNKKKQSPKCQNKLIKQPNCTCFVLKERAVSSKSDLIGVGVANLPFTITTIKVSKLDLEDGLFGMAWIVISQPNLNSGRSKPTKCTTRNESDPLMLNPERT